LSPSLMLIVELEVRGRSAVEPELELAAGDFGRQTKGRTTGILRPNSPPTNIIRKTTSLLPLPTIPTSWWWDVRQS
jgi:hypothetical protein